MSRLLIKFLARKLSSHMFVILYILSVQIFSVPICELYRLSSPEHKNVPKIVLMHYLSAQRLSVCLNEGPNRYFQARLFLGIIRLVLRLKSIY
jgi:hypothetical protein